MDRNDGGPAFPGLEPKTNWDGSARAGGPSIGMTMRDWFAGQAMAALVADTDLYAAAKSKGVEREAAIARIAYITADAMLAVRTK